METPRPSSSNEFDLPGEVLQVLPSDPFAQLDIASKITSIALSTRVSSLESEASVLRSQVTDKDTLISDLHSQIESLDASLSKTSDRLARAEQEKESLVKENSDLSSIVAKLRRDVSKLEMFRKTLMQSLQEEEGSIAGVQANGTKEIPAHTVMSEQSHGGDDVTQPPSVYSSIESVNLERGNSYLEDRESEAPRPRISPGLLLASQTSTSCLTSPGSPTVVSASVSLSKTSKPASPRRHSASFSTSRGMLDSLPSSTHSSFSNLDSGSQSGRTRVDGKEFFRQVRSRLSYEQFGAFLANVKELNSHKQTKEEMLSKADEIFGSDNKDLYTIFEGLLTRNVH